MSVDIGIGVSAESVRVVMLRRGRLAWYGERETSDSLPLGDALAGLLVDAPMVGWRRRSAVAAVGPSAMHLRRVDDLPPRASDRILTAIVREDLGRYFVQTGAPPVITAARRRGGDVWVGALDSVLVTAIAAACERYDIRLRAVAPSVSLAGSLLESGALHWPDGELLGLAEFEAHELVAYRRVPRATLSVEEPVMLPPVPVIDGALSDPARFTDAWLAAKAGFSHSLAYRPESSHHAEADTRRVRRRLAFAALACAIGILSAMVMPIAGARYIEWHAGRTLATLQSDAQEAARSERALALASRELRALSAFDRSARLTTATLASLTTAIEPPSMLLSFQSDSAGATLVALTPSAAELIDELSEVSGVASPAIVGSVTPVLRAASSAPPMFGAPAAPIAALPADSASQLQRVTIRFAWRDDTQSGNER